MAETTRKLAASTRWQFFFVASTTVSTRCLVQNFQLICYSQRVHTRHNTTTRQFEMFKMAEPDGSLQWWNIAGSLYKEGEAAEKDHQTLPLDRCSRKYWHVHHMECLPFSDLRIFSLSIPLCEWLTSTPFLLLVYYLFFCWIFAVALVWCLGIKFHKWLLDFVRLLMGYHSNADNKFMDDYKTKISFEGKNGSKKEYKEVF